MPKFVEVCKDADLAEGEVKLVVADRTKVALCRYAGTVYALSNFCPHLTGNLGEGKLDGDTLVCPEHGWRFKLQGGRCVNVSGQSAHAFPVVVKDGAVEVGV